MCTLCSVSNPDAVWIRIQSGQWIRIRIQEDKNDSQKKKKLRNFSFWSAGCSVLRAEGFSCSLDVFYGGLGISKLQFFIQKNIKFFSAVNFVQFLVIKTLDPDWIRIGIQPKMLDPDPKHWVIYKILHAVFFNYMNCLLSVFDYFCSSQTFERGGGVKRTERQYRQKCPCREQQRLARVFHS